MIPSLFIFGAHTRSLFPILVFLYTYSAITTLLFHPPARLLHFYVPFFLLLCSPSVSNLAIPIFLFPVPIPYSLYSYTCFLSHLPVPINLFPFYCSTMPISAYLSLFQHKLFPIPYSHIPILLFPFTYSCLPVSIYLYLFSYFLVPIFTYLSRFIFSVSQMPVPNSLFRYSQFPFPISSIPIPIYYIPIPLFPIPGIFMFLFQLFPYTYSYILPL